MYKKSFYPTLDRLPRTRIDKYGNLNACGEGQPLRGRVEYILNLDPKHLSLTTLSELLNWLRWGSTSTVMWECTLPELIQIIEKWLCANPEVPWWKYNFYGIHELTWEDLWNRGGKKEGITRKMRCRCGKLHDDLSLECQKCWQRWHQMSPVNWGPRGENTYNLVLRGDGGSVASTVWNNRNWIFWVPEEFERTNPYEVCYSPNFSLLDA